MYNIISRFAEDEVNNGLMLIDMPTGSGKTYTAIKYIFDSCIKEENKNRKYIFVTTLKKNLPIEDIRKRFNDAGKLHLFNEKVLFLDSNMDSVINGWSDEVVKNIPYEIRKTEEYQRFLNDLSFVKWQREKRDSDLKKHLPSIEANLRDKSEPAFRRIISELLDKKFSSVEKKLYAIKTDKDWQWISKLYPAVFTRDRQILFMSMDKFLGRNTTVVEPSYMFFSSDVIKDAVIFIDEFDATKDTILKRIIENGLRDRVDYIELFKHIYAALHTDAFPAALTTPSKERMKGNYRNQSLDGIISNIKEKADYIFRTYNLQFKHRTSVEVEDTHQNYLFQDHQFHSVLNSNNSYITMKCDSKQRINAIGFAKSKPEWEKNNIQVMLGQLRGFIKYFQVAINILAINYMQCKMEKRKDGEDAFSMESAIRSVLALFRLGDDSIDYLTSQILISTHKIKGNIESADYDLSFYENGFRYYAFENDLSHDMQSQIMMYSFQNTPEKTILRFCEKAKVIGISATATVPSVISNFDIRYMKERMQKVFVPVTEEERSRLLMEFKDSQRGYEDINIHVDLLGEKGNYTDQSWKLVFDSEELAQKVSEDVKRLFPENEDNKHFYKERYLRISMAFKQFVTHDDIYSFLCVLTKHPKRGDKYLDKDLLEKIFSYIAEERDRKHLKKSIRYLDGEEYDDKKDSIIKELANGKKLFVISVYQTIGAGQNIQYPVPADLKDSVIKINSRESKEEKDFDAIYLDKPSNLIVNLVDNLGEQEFVKYIFQMEYLQETAEISSGEAVKNIKKAFKTFAYGQKRAWDEWANVYDRKSVMLASTRYIIQAIGRICRTNYKNRNIYVYADDRIAENIDISIIDNRVFNPEFMMLVDRIQQSEIKTPVEASLEDAASLKAVRVNKDINNMLKNEWTEAKIKRWKDLRDLVLRFPTVSDEDAQQSFIIKNYYAQLPEKNNRLFYSQDADYNNISVVFKKDKYHQMEVSEEGSKLDEMLRIPGVKDMFVENGWACCYESNDYLMTPALWNNIYKGALGEVVGKFLFRKLFRVELEEIDDENIFELFDYKIPGTSIYVDFKNWHEGETAEKKDILEKISRKAVACGCRCAIISNIIADSSWDVSDTEMDGIRIVSVPALVKNDNGKLSYSEKAIEIIRECIYEFKNQD